jgi:hypothetical protein
MGLQADYELEKAKRKIGDRLEKGVGSYSA